MLKNAMFRRGSLSFEAVCLAIVVCFVVGIVFVAKVKTPGQVGLVNNAHAAVYGLPIPTKLLPVTDNRSYPLLKGIKVNPKDPFHLEFIIDSQDKDEISKEEFNRLVEYFLAALTTPQDELWVNLSPHEQDRVIPQDLSYTELGKDLLGQDYILKQLTSSLTYPETELGKKYWKRLHEEVYQLAGTTNIPINTFNKVWIVPKSTRIYEKDNVALITEATLKAMHEEDYFALDKGTASKDQDKSSKINKLSAKVLKEIVLPEIEYNINHGEHFAKLRQMYHSLILAAWFKKTLKDSIYQHYIDQNKVEGIDLEDRGAKDKIFNLYVEAYKKGVYDYIKTDKEPQTSKKLRRRYCSGGIPAGEFGNVDVVTHDNENEAALVSEEMKKNGAEMGTVGLTGSNGENLEGDSTEINVTEVVGFDNVVEAMREEHKRTGKKIRAEFNGVILEFTGEESNEDMLNGFREKWSQKNKAHRDSPEGQAAKKEREEAARASNEKKQAWESKFGEYKESDPVRWIEAYLQANRSERGDVVEVEEIIIGMTIEVAATLVGLNPIGKFYDSEAQLPDEVDQLIAGQGHSGGTVGVMLGMLGDAVAAYEEANFTEMNVVGVGDFSDVVEAMRDEHKRTGKKIRAEFSGVTLEFTGEESNEDMFKGFKEKLDQKSKAYWDSPEGQAAKKEREEAARASNEKKQAWESKFGEYKESDPVRWIEAYLQANRSERGDVVGVEEIIIGMTIEVAATLVGLNPIGKFYDSEAQLPDEVDQLIAGQDHSGGSVGAMLGMLGDAVAAYEEANFTEINVVGVGGFYNVVEAMRDEHRRTGKKIRAEFNGVILEFTGEESNEEMLKGFREKLDQKNKAYRDSPEGQADMRERKESANEGDQPMADRDHGDGVAGLMLNHMPSDVAAAYEANARDEDRKKNIAHQLTLLIEAKGIEITEDINASIEIAAGRMRDNQKAAGMSLPEDIKKDDLHSIVAEAANFASITGGVRDDSDEVGGIDLDYSQLGIKGGQVEFSNISPAAAEILGRGLKIGRTEIKHGENLKIWLGIKEEPELSYLSD